MPTTRHRRKRGRSGSDLEDWMIDFFLYGRHAPDAPKFRFLHWQWSPFPQRLLDVANPFSKVPGVADEARYFWENHRDELLAIWRDEGNEGRCHAQRRYGEKIGGWG